MKIPIFNSLYSSSNIINSKNIDLKTLNNLDFKTVDYRRFPLTKILNSLPEKSSLFETILVSINDKLVELFLDNKIKYTDISKKMHNILRLKNLKKYKMINVKNINEIIKINKETKSKVEQIIKKLVMFRSSLKISILFFFLLISFNTFLRAEIVSKIIIEGNNRISPETIKMFSGVSEKEDLSESDLNQVLKNLYDSNFFELVSVKLENNTLTISVKENPVIQNINYEGIKSTDLLSDLKKNVVLKSRSSFNEILLKKDKENITNFLKNLGYYFSEIDISIQNLEDNKINLTYNISLGEKAKIKKISFIGNKIFKDKKLKSIILSEEYKSWKFLSGKKYLNEAMINYDKRLLKNFYLNKGFYNVSINSSYAKVLDNQEFELILILMLTQKYFLVN